MKSLFLRLIALRKYRIALVLLDAVFINLSIYLSISLLKRYQPPVDFYISATLIWFILGILFLLYSFFRYSVRYISLAIFMEWMILNLVVLYVDIFKMARASLLFTFPVMIFFVLGYRLLFRAVRYLRQNKKDKDETRVLILGIDKEAKEIADLIKANQAMNYHVAGFLTLDHHQEQGGAIDAKHILGDMDDLYKIAKRRKIDEVIIAFPSYTPLLHKRIERVIREHYELGVNFKVGAYLFETLVGRLKMGRISELFLLDIVPDTDSGVYLTYKRLFDLIFSFLGLVLFSPIMLLIAGILKFYEKGPVFYKNERIGESGRPFMLYKFRSMTPEAGRAPYPVRAKENDERITPFGKFLRSNSLDELPQLWNVLKGEMSLIGPRPEMTHFVNSHHELRGKRFNVKPGITGLAQVNGRQDLSARHKAKYDYIYLKNYSFILDMKILSQTFRTVLNKHGVR